MIQRLARQLGKEERDLRVLATIIEHQPIGITRIAEETGIDEHKTRYSLRMLEKDGLVEPTPNGAVTAEGFEADIADINDGIDDLIERMQSLKEIDL
jgi:predicted transcriptional regulator